MICTRYSMTIRQAILVINAVNGFNIINRKVLLHSTKYLFPELATFIYNCYVIPARLSIMGGKEIRFHERTTQGDPTAMAVCAIELTHLDNLPSISKHAVFADDLTGARKLHQKKSWWDHLQVNGPKYDYHPKLSKSCVIVKDQYKQNGK